MSARIHPTAVDPSAQLGADVEVGPYCVVGSGVILGDGCVLQHHVTVMGPSRIGPNNIFYSCACIGQQTQDLKYAGEPTYLEIGAGNCFREFVTVHRATAREGVTRIGNHGNFLAYSHIAHDCVVGDHVIFSNNGTLAGHVVVEDYAVIGGLTAIHQFCRIGAHAITGGCSKIVQDVPPFMIADGNPAEIRGINSIGLERAGVAPERIRVIKEIYRRLYRSKLNLSQALEEIRKDLLPNADVERVLAFIEGSQRGIIR
jgi:UDP-N-acetylglucosamine acyltransferase